MTRGLTHIYHGEGKGKTTAAMGLAMRALGAGLQVRIFQFMKTSPRAKWPSLAKLAPASCAGRTATCASSPGT
jgi:cob(I)alamin adenosyltransferase